MKTAARRSPADRDRAVARLRTLTIGTGIAGFAAIGVFGSVAALSYDGTTDVVTAAAVATIDSATSTGSTPTTPTTSTTSGTTSVQATAAPTTSSGTAHAATGSS
jgi:hypothetical protein